MTVTETYSVTLADVGEGLAEAEIVRWLVGKGDTVEADQPIVEVETDKSVIDLPAPVAGVITALNAQEGDVVPVGAKLAVISPSAPAATQVSGRPTQEPVPAGTETEAMTTDAPAAPTSTVLDAEPASPSSGGRVLASPANRRRALELGIDLTSVRGTGPGGRISADDLECVARAAAIAENGNRDGSVPQPQPQEGSGMSAGRPMMAWANKTTDDDFAVDERPLGVRRRAVAETMTRSWREIPHITELREIDATALVEVRKRLAARFEPEGISFTVTPLLALATVAALRRHPELHATLDLDGGRALLHRRCNLGVAVATAEGLVVPVVADAHHKGVRELAVDINGLGVAARNNRLRPEQVQGGTFTISNFGSLGVWLGTPIIRPPEVAIAGFGRITEKVVAVDGVPVVRSVLPVAVSADHRMVDGDDLARFVSELGTLLSDPVLLLAEIG